jgi:hypothetical protein
MRGREKEKARAKYVERAAGLKIDQFKNATSPGPWRLLIEPPSVQPKKSVP